MLYEKWSRKTWSFLTGLCHCILHDQQISVLMSETDTISCSRFKTCIKISFPNKIYHIYHTICNNCNTNCLPTLCSTWGIERNFGILTDHCCWEYKTIDLKYEIFCYVKWYMSCDHGMLQNMDWKEKMDSAKVYTLLYFWKYHFYTTQRNSFTKKGCSDLEGYISDFFREIYVARQ